MSKFRHVEITKEEFHPKKRHKKLQEERPSNYLQTITLMEKLGIKMVNNDNLLKSINLRKSNKERGNYAITTFNEEEKISKKIKISSLEKRNKNINKKDFISSSNEKRIIKKYFIKKVESDNNNKITTSEPLKERLKIKAKYIVVYGRDLIDDFQSKLSGNFKKVMIALYTDKYEYDAQQIYTAVKGLGTDEDTLIEIIGTRPGWMIKKIKKAYKNLYNKDLEEDVKDDTSGNFQKLLITLLQCNRNENNEIDLEKCINICDELYNAGEKKLGTDEQIFNKYIGNCSPAELMTISREYHKKYNKSLMKVIDSEFSGDIKKLIKTVLYANISPSEYFATRINIAVKGLGTNEKIM